jgi:hypothetical protein
LTTAELPSILSQRPTEDGEDLEFAASLNRLRVLYEPFLQALSNYFGFKVPRFVPDRPGPDNWQTSAWTKRTPGITELPAAGRGADDHFG